MTEVKHENGVSKFSTGAVRSSDAKDVRFDLISPYAFQQLMYCLGNGDETETMESVDAVVLECLQDVYVALSGEWNNWWLENAAVGLLCAMHREESGEPYGRNDRLPYVGLRRLAETYKEGADKYSDHNWLRGFPVSDLLNHAIRHLCIYLDGDRSEDHLAHATWGLFAAIHSHHFWPHLNKNLLGPGCTPPAKEPEAKKIYQGSIFGQYRNNAGTIEVRSDEKDEWTKSIAYNPESFDFDIKHGGLIEIV